MNDQTPHLAALPPGVSLTADIEFARPQGQALTLDLYRPDQDGDVPVVVFIFGGAWMKGDKTSVRAANGPLHLTAHGFAVAALSYRLSQTARFPAQIRDVKSGIAFLRRESSRLGLDAERFAAFGPSAGGHLAALAGVTDGVETFEPGEPGHPLGTSVQAVVDFYGPTDFLQMDTHSITHPNGAQLVHDAADSPESRLIGGPIQDNPGLAAVANPLTWLNRQAPPFLVIHGDADPLVPFNQSELLIEGLAREGVPHEFVRVRGGGHGQGAGFDTGALDPVVAAFLGKHLT